MAIIESFWLYGKPGTRYRVHIYQDSIETSAMPGSSSLGGKKTALLEDGALLHQVDENTFKNTVTGELLSRTESPPYQPGEKTM
jgi:hypothetical protein